MTFNKVYFILCLLCFMGLGAGKCNWLIIDHKTIQFVFCVLLSDGAEMCGHSAQYSRVLGMSVAGYRGRGGHLAMAGRVTLRRPKLSR